MKTQREDGHEQARREDLEETNFSDILILDFYPPEMSENKGLLFKLSSLCYFVMAVLTD